MRGAVIPMDLSKIKCEYLNGAYNGLANLLGIDASDLLKLMDPKMTKKQELEQKIVEFEKEIKAKTCIFR